MQERLTPAQLVILIESCEKSIKQYCVRLDVARAERNHFVERTSITFLREYKETLERLNAQLETALILDSRRARYVSLPPKPEAH